jgi:hypothetical protein
MNRMSCILAPRPPKKAVQPALDSCYTLLRPCDWYKSTSLARSYQQLQRCCLFHFAHSLNHYLSCQ